MAARQGGDRETHDPGQAGFHYSREERLAERGERPTEQGGIFVRNRGLLFVLLDIVIVLIMFLLYLFFLRPDPGTVEVGGYRVQGHAFRFDDAIYATVEIWLLENSEPDASSAPASGNETLVELRFPDGEKVTDVLPSRADFPTTIRHVIETGVEPDEEDVSVEVLLADASDTLRLRVSDGSE